MLGHLNQSVYHELLEEGRGALMTDLARRAGDGEHGGFVVAHVDLDYHREVRKDHGEVEIVVRLSRVGRSSITLEHEVKLPDGAGGGIRQDRAGGVGPGPARQARAHRRRTRRPRLRRPRRRAQATGPRSGTSATASISTSIRGSISALTSTIVMTGGDVAEALAVGAADLSSPADVGDVDAGLDHVVAARRRRATSSWPIRRRISTVCSYGVSPITTPLGSTEVVPPTSTSSPARTTRLNPNGSSNGDGGSPAEAL